MNAIRHNALGQPIGPALPDWSAPTAPARREHAGRWCDLEPLDPARHARELFDALAEDREGRCWTYLAYGPFETLDAYSAWLAQAAAGEDPLFFVLRDKDSGRASGVASYLNVHPALGSVEVGHLCFAPALQRTRAATEGMFLMMAHAFDLGYRRYEWKCDALNAASRRAAERYGFSFEGVFRQALVYKGRNRDTAWYSVVDTEWPRLAERFERWLAPQNFDADGRQRCALGALEAPPAGLAFRLAQRADLEAIVALLADDPLGRGREDPGPPLPDEYVQAWAELSAGGTSEVCVATDAGRVVGTLQLTYTPGLSRRGARRACLEAVRVGAEQRGRGVGKAFIGWARERARDRGCRLLQLTSDLTRPDAQRFYTALGFEASHVGMKLSLD